MVGLGFLLLSALFLISVLIAGAMNPVAYHDHANRRATRNEE